MLNAGSMFAIPRSKGTYWTYGDHLCSAGAAIIGIVDVRKSNLDDETVNVYWPTFSQDRVCWSDFRVRQTDITLIPASAAKVIADRLVNVMRSRAQSSGQDDNTTVLRSARGIIPGIDPSAQDFMLLLFGRIKGKCVRNLAFSLRKFPSFARKVKITDPNDAYWPDIRVEERFTRDHQWKIGDSYGLSWGFTWMRKEECLIAEELLPISDHQALRLAEEYQAQLNNFVDPIESAFRALREAAFPDPLPRPKERPSYELIAASAPAGTGSELEASSAPAGNGTELMAAEEQK